MAFLVSASCPSSVSSFLLLLLVPLCCCGGFTKPPPVAVAAGAMFSRRWRFGGDRFAEFDLFADDTNAVTLTQAINAAASEAPDSDGSELFGTLRGTVVGLRYYTGVVRISPGIKQSTD